MRRRWPWHNRRGPLMATANRRRGGVVAGRAAVRAKTALAPPAQPLLPPSMPIATARSRPTKSATPRPRSRRSIATTTESSIAPNSDLRAADLVDPKVPTDPRTAPPAADGSVDLLPMDLMDPAAVDDSADLPRTVPMDRRTAPPVADGSADLRALVVVDQGSVM